MQIVLCSLLWPIGAIAQSPPASNASYYTNPIPTVIHVSNPNGQEVILLKDLSGWSGYGEGSSGTDILYTGEAATWTFELPPDIDPSSVTSAAITASLIADDHSDLPLEWYRLATWINGIYLGEEAANLPHGTPWGGPFQNWVQRDYKASPSATYSISINNTSEPDQDDFRDWIGVDWIELNLRLWLAPPTNLKVEPVASTRLRLAWDYDATSNIDGFEIERKDGDTATSGTWSPIYTLDSPSARTWEDSGLGLTPAQLEAGKAYSYRIRAYSGTKRSVFSSPTSAETYAGSPPFTFTDVTRCMKIACGLSAGVSVDMTRLNVADNSNLDLCDAARLARKVAGLEANP